jgi:hypothetical protein
LRLAHEQKVITTKASNPLKKPIRLVKTAQVALWLKHVMRARLLPLDGASSQLQQAFPSFRKNGVSLRQFLSQKRGRVIARLSLATLLVKAGKTVGTDRICAANLGKASAAANAFFNQPVGWL